MQVPEITMLRARPFNWVLIFYDSCWCCASSDHDHSHHGHLGAMMKYHNNGYLFIPLQPCTIYNMSFLILLQNDGVFIFLVDFFDGNNAQSCLLRLSSTGLVYYSYKYWCNGRKSSGHHAHCLVRGRGGGSTVEQLSLFTQIINISYQKHTHTNYQPC